MRVIQDVLMKQSLAYRFPYSSFDFKTNITSVILTEGKREALFAKVRSFYYSLFATPLHRVLTLSMKSRLTFAFLSGQTPPAHAFTARSQILYRRPVSSIHSVNSCSESNTRTNRRSKPKRHSRHTSKRCLCVTGKWSVLLVDGKMIVLPPMSMAYVCVCQGMIP